MAYASQSPTALLLVSYIVPCHSLMDTKPGRHEIGYYRPIRLAAGF